ncbi:MAG: DUF2321 domain-containing protein [Verrucomicrobia bacterium]|nr:DUF2321 domain-containing protein [Verrucomicrobiota bacterium]
MNFDEESVPYHDVALVCLNGHVINDSVRNMPQFNKKFCDRCGEPTIQECPECKESIQGHYWTPGVFGVGKVPAPSFCQHCGKPFPWTKRRLAAAKEVAEQLNDISPAEKQQLKQTIDDLAHEGPRTEPAKLRFKTIMRKVGKESYDVMKGVVTDLVSETVKKSIFGG